MKKSLKICMMFVALAFGLFLTTGTVSKAATDTAWKANVKQTNASKSGFELSWDKYLGAGYYSVMLSQDGGANYVNPGTETYNSYTTATNDTVYNVGAGAVYYAKIYAYAESGYSKDNIPIATSEQIQVGTLPDVPDVQNLKQTGATADSVTMTWDAVPNATNYSIYLYNSSSDYTKITDTTETSYQLTGLTASYSGRYFIIASQTTAAGVSGMSSNFTAVAMKTTPTKVLNVQMTNLYDNISVAYFGWVYVNNADGYQFQIRNYKGKKLVEVDSTSSSVRISPFKKGVFSKYRVRAYINVNGTKVYGPWSDERYYASSSKMTVTRSANKKKITVKWKKIMGASGYRIYLSTKSGSGFKKVKTVSSKKSSCTITKIGKKKLNKKKKYYVQIVYTCKNGKKTITSDIVGKTSYGV